MQSERKNIKVLVGMSGGVDSSMAAALLVEAGYSVTGAYMKNWTLDVPGMQCPWAEDLAYAKRTAVKLGIELRVYDFQEAYKRDVVDYLVREYEAGRTPNPDIMCNQDVKFGLFLDTALAEGFDYIATGHYASRAPVPLKGEQVHTRASGDVQPAFVSSDSCTEGHGIGTSETVLDASGSSETCADSGESVRLLHAADAHKDQTYFLYRMGQHALQHTLFPLGAYTKAHVREMAVARKLPAATKPDSQGICFIGEAPIQEFLRMYVSPQPGKIIDADTHEVVGAHEGALFFTLGQRKGLGVGGGAPYYVVGKNMAANEVYVSHNSQAPDLQTTELLLENCTWLAGKGPEASPTPGTYLVRTRHTGPLLEANVDSFPGEQGSGARSIRIILSGPQERVAPGQSVVIYSGEICLGGGIVAE